MHKLLPLLIIALLLGAIVFYLPLKRELVYALNIDEQASNPCCRVEDILRSSGAFDPSAQTAIYDNEPVNYPGDFLASLNSQQNLAEASVLATYNSANQEKWIEVNLATQTLKAWEGSTVVMEYQISSGLWNSTPKGTFEIWYKTRSQVMTGGSKELGTYYYLPNVPDNMFFYKGYAIHGAYWHHNWGHPMSHGCINEPLDKAQILFDWAGPVLPPTQNAIRATPDNPGTRVVID